MRPVESISIDDLHYEIKLTAEAAIQISLDKVAAMNAENKATKKSLDAEALVLARVMSSLDALCIGLARHLGHPFEVTVEGVNGKQITIGSPDQK